MKLRYIYQISIKALELLFRYLWRLWFIITSTFFTMIIYPFVLMSLQLPNNKLFFFLRKTWAKCIIYSIGISYKLIGDFPKEKNYIVIANHVSKLDAIFLCAIIPNDLFFVGKKELAKIPIFGKMYKKTNILVDRNSYTSRKQAYVDSKNLVSSGKKLCIFPEGTIPKEHIKLSKFKDGVFSIAVDTQTNILPILFLDNKKYYPYNWNRGKVGRVRIKLCKPIEIKKYTDKKDLIKQSFNFMKQEIIKYEKES